MPRPIDPHEDAPRPEEGSNQTLYPPQESKVDQMRRHTLNRLSRVVKKTHQDREKLYKMARTKLRLKERALLEGTDPELLGVRDIEVGRARNYLHLREGWAKQTYSQEVERVEKDYEVRMWTEKNMGVATVAQSIREMRDRVLEIRDNVTISQGSTEDLLGLHGLPSLEEVATVASTTGSLPVFRFGAGYSGMGMDGAAAVGERGRRRGASGSHGSKAGHLNSSSTSASAHPNSTTLAEGLGDAAIIRLRQAQLRRMHIATELRKEEKQQDWELVMERAGMMGDEEDDEGDDGDEVAGGSSRG
ncbi:hypothetical protein BJ684DRAFT_14382 [Piptocephalis cylindrospora]|uniref:Sds3-like-domain-containing protein n=1 Tax=Piptocephalis cylindrospora TaxID=1907219 RepID=A0A4P9YA78_9FUNG|nr:hypothetical protein BJ684DRAFT_14382 [Piptocephalis cylindrospora]|eukprot:RKP15371.1 hypothetical protein BJ684DRAFT_14382 [Piptocephalis cylindrospora]